MSFQALLFSRPLCVAMLMNDILPTAVYLQRVSGVYVEVELKYWKRMFKECTTSLTLCVTNSKVNAMQITKYQEWS